MKRRFAKGIALSLVIILAISLTAFAKGRPGGGETAVGNNLSFPVITADGFSITPIPEFSFDAQYTGDYTDLNADELAALEGYVWYPQQTEGNLWQADFINANAPELAQVTYIDWGDIIESNNPKVRRPFRLEVTLYKVLETTMTGFTMAVLEYPSSPTELQGTNQATYESPEATITSTSPKLLIQYLGSAVPVLNWDSDKNQWIRSDETIPPVVEVGFGQELNVGGKYIFGASGGGWKPAAAGYYRITFYIPSGSSSQIDLSGAYIGNQPTSEEDLAAVPVVDAENNLTYVDVMAVNK